MLICFWTAAGMGVCLGRGIPASSGTTLSPTRVQLQQQVELTVNNVRADPLSVLLIPAS